MKAVVYHGPRDVRVDQVPDPGIEAPSDVIVKITTTNICGSDLHMYEGRTNMEPGRVLGHENLGEIIETGAAVEDRDALLLRNAAAVILHLDLDHVARPDHGHEDAVRTLLEQGADPNLRNNNGQTPIAGAAFKGFKPIIEILLDHGADVEGASPDGRTALMVAAMFNRTDIVDLLISRGANPQARDAGGNSAADAAARMGAADTAAQLTKPRG